MNERVGRRKGRIWPEYWIDCGECEHHMPVGEIDLLRAEQAARTLGWTERRFYGWLCPKCTAAKGAAP